MYILGKTVQKLKNTIFLHFITIFLNFALKVRVFQPIFETKKVNNVCENVWLFFLAENNYLDPQKTVIFELQLYPIDHKTYRGSLNFPLMTLEDTSTHTTHICLRKVYHIILQQINYFA